jgi:hypothetical protein
LSAFSTRRDYGQVLEGSSLGGSQQKPPIGFVLSDYGTLPRVFNNLVALFLKKMSVHNPILNLESGFTLRGAGCQTWGNDWQKPAC